MSDFNPRKIRLAKLCIILSFVSLFANIVGHLLQDYIAVWMGIIGAGLSMFTAIWNDKRRLNHE